MPLLADNLASRIAGILLAGLAIMLAIGAVLLIWPGGDGGGVRLYQLPLPSEARAIVQALEATPPAVRPRVIAALDTGVIGVRAVPQFPPPLRRARPADARDPGFSAYQAALGDRRWRIDVRRGGRLRDAPLPGRHALRLIVRLENGEVVVLSRRPPQSARQFLGRAVLAAAALLGVMLLMLALAVLQTTGPVAALARAVTRFGDELEAKPLPLSGPREIRQLSAAFNAMQARIRGLVDERTRMLAAIAHDLRTYLTRLTLRAEFIDDPVQRAKAAADLAEMSRLLDDTLLFAGQAAGRGEGARPIDLRRELETLVETRAEMGETIGLADGPAPAVLATPMALRRMLANLVDNALRYGGGGASIETRVEDGFVRIAVLDRGPGLPQAALARIV
ncbi:MAG: HAMP domain-containing protein, partial [Caulobacter sp.]